ncbi:hypothetical protein ANN_21282 [Periplaneta americana]|uniref:Uncharacterized protein n=1 Tax=Periplaneta americana TaxID=6978 RepID=A0ABQ8SEW6_PERAM|nr:hypothetical protein ANN_21282 [Periplaneta americana]
MLEQFAYPQLEEIEATELQTTCQYDGPPSYYISDVRDFLIGGLEEMFQYYGWQEVRPYITGLLLIVLREKYCLLCEDQRFTLPQNRIRKQLEINPDVFDTLWMEIEFC